MIKTMQTTFSAACLCTAASLTLAMSGMKVEPNTAPDFTDKPKAVVADGQVKITFAVRQYGDVTVSVTNEKGETVRHLAAGVLGRNAPEPFTKESLKQSLVWDGKKDDGKQAAKGKYSIRVDLGTRAVYDRTIGQDNRYFGGIYAMASGPGGNLYIYCGRGITVLNRKGKYSCQIVPAPHHIAPAKLQGLKPVTLADGSVYRSRGYDLPAKMKAVGSMTISSRGEILIPGSEGYARNITRINIDGTVSKKAFDTRLTKLADIGYLYVAASPDGKTVYMSGAEAGYRGDDARKACYRQVVYRLLIDSKGPAEIFTGDDENGGGPGFSVRYPKGLACDKDGHVYVCNYRGDNIAVYTPQAGFLRAIKVPAPQQVAVHPKTGQLYVLAGKQKGYSKYGYDYPATMTEARLLRFSAEGKLEMEMKLEDPYVRKGKSRPGPSYMLSMAADFTEKTPVVWLGVSYPGNWSTWRLVRIEDEGKAFGKPRECYARAEDAFKERPQQLLLDSKKDVLYFNAHSRLRRYSGEGKPLEQVKLYPKEGAKDRYNVIEAAIGPDNHIYSLTSMGKYGGWKDIRIRRFSTKGIQVPFPGGKTETEKIYRATKGAGGSSARGFTVDTKGNMYVMYFDQARPKEELAAWERGWPYSTAVAMFGPDGGLINKHHIAHLRAGAQGVRVDSKGNVYVGDNTMPIGVTYPKDFMEVLPDPLKRAYPAMLADGSFDPLLRWMGSVFKFGPEGGRLVGLPGGARFSKAKRPKGDLWKPAPEIQWFLHNNNKVRMKGAKWQYHGFSPVPAQYQGVTHVERCVCRAGRFDLDEFDRVFVPDKIRKRVTILDSAGNVVTRLGAYGNQDARSQGTDIRLMDPQWVAAASDRVYVGEGAPCRVVRILLKPVVRASCDAALQ